MLSLEFFDDNHYNVIEPKTYSSLLHNKESDSNFGSNHPLSENKQLKIKMQKKFSRKDQN